MQQYLDLLSDVLRKGEDRIDRTGTGTLSVFGRSVTYDLKNGLEFPLVTTKKMFWRGIVEELLWVIRGDTSVKTLQDKKVHIWDAWAPEDGDLGPVYGHQLRNWNSENVDQLKNVIEQLKEDPQSRRHIINLWNPGMIDDMALPPCHGVVIQFYVTNDSKLDCCMYQRSADLFLGVPFNIASYSLLTHMVAKVCGHTPGKFIHVMGDCHIYKNHIPQVKEQLERCPYPPPQVVLTSVENIDDYTYDKIQLCGYRSHPAIKGDVSV